MKEMSTEEMKSIYGVQYDVEPQSVSVTVVTSFVASYLSSAAFKCGKDNKK